MQAATVKQLLDAVQAYKDKLAAVNAGALPLLAICFDSVRVTWQCADTTTGAPAAAGAASAAPVAAAAPAAPTKASFKESGHAHAKKADGVCVRAATFFPLDLRYASLHRRGSG